MSLNRDCIVHYFAFGRGGQLLAVTAAARAVNKLCTHVRFFYFYVLLRFCIARIHIIYIHDMLIFHLVYNVLVTL